MRKSLRLSLPLLWALLLVAGTAFASEYLLGTITSTGASVNQTSTATPFKIPPLHRTLFWCDAAVYYNWTTSSSGTVSSTTGIPVSANTPWDTSGGTGDRYLNIISQSGTANCRVFDVVGW